MLTLPTTPTALAPPDTTPLDRLPGRPAGQIPLNLSRCNECGETLAATAKACPGCRQTTGPFTPLVGYIRIVTGGDGRRWLCLYRPTSDPNRWAPSEARPLNPEAERWLARTQREASR